MPDPQSTAAAPAIVVRNEADEEREFVLDFIEKSDALRSRYIATWDQILSNYLVSAPPGLEGPTWSSVSRVVVPLKQRWGGRIYLKDPETHQVVETLAAQALTLLVGSDEFIETVPVGSDDYEKARFIGRVLTGTLQMPGVYRTLYELLKDSFIFGTAIVEIGWEQRSRAQVVRRPQLNANGFLVGSQFGVEDVVYRDNPLIRAVDIYDFYPDPSGTRIQENMLGAAKRFRATKRQLRELVDAGTYNKPEAARRAAQLSTLDAQQPPNAARHDRERFPSDSPPDKYGMMTGFEFWGEVPYKPRDGARNRVLTVINGEVVRSHINTYLDGSIPFKEVVMNPISGRFYGLSPAEVIRYLQDSTDHMTMALTEATNLAIRGPLMVGSSWQGDVDRLKRRKPHDVLEVGDVEAIAPVPTDFSALAISAAELARRKLTMREASGATNPLQAIPTSDRATATEVSQLVRLATQRVDVMVRLIERDDMPWIGRTLHSRWRQFISDEGAVARLTGESLPFRLEDIDIDADVRFVGSRQAQTQLQKIQGYLQAIQLLGSAPDAVAIMPELFVRLLRDGQEIPDAEAIVARAREMVLALKAAEQQEGATGVPGVATESAEGVA